MTHFSVPAGLGARRADRFARALDSGTDEGTDLALLDVVAALRAVPAPDAPRPEFSRDLRERLMAEADTALVPSDPRLVLPERSGRSRRRVAVAAAASVLVGTSAGMAVAAQSSVQGDPLYGVKRGLEAITASMSLSQTSRGQDLLSQSRTRLSETRELVGSGEQVSPAREQAARETLQRFADSATQGSDLLLAGYQRDTAASADVAAVRSFAEVAMRELRREAAQAPPRLQDSFSAAAGTLTGLDQRARELCAACGSSEPLALPDDLMPVSAGYALDQLIDGSSEAGQTADAATTPSSGASRAPLGAAGGKAPGSQRIGSGDAVSRLRSTLRSPSTQGTDDSSTSSAQQRTRLLRLPGSQSGAPSVIDLDRTVDEATSTLRKTTDRLTKTRQGSASETKKSSGSRSGLLGRLGGS